MCVIQILETMNSLFSRQESFSLESQETLAETLSLLYYFKHLAVKQVFQSSKIEIGNSKNIFTHQLYLKCPDGLPLFYKIFLEDPTAISVHPKGMDLDYGSILGLKQNKQKHMEFTAGSHAQKLRTLMGKLDAYVQS